MLIEEDISYETVEFSYQEIKDALLQYYKRNNGIINFRLYVNNLECIKNSDDYSIKIFIKQKPQ